MSDQIAPVVPDPAVEPAAEETWTARPEWEAALAPIADSLRPGIYKQIKTSEAEAQKAVEAARAGSVEPMWADFAKQAKDAGVDPATLIESYNIRQDLLRNPQDFQARLQKEIDGAVASGQMTKAEGAAAAAQGQQIADAGDALKTPEQEAIETLQAQVAGMSATQQQQYEAAVEAQQQVDAKVYYDEFTNVVTKTFTDAGYAGASPETKIAVMRMADSALNGDITDTLTLTQAVQGAFNAMLAFRDTQAGVTTAPVAGQVATAPPVGGGRGIAAEPPAKFTDDLAGRKARVAAMLEEGRRQAAAGITE